MAASSDMEIDCSESDDYSSDDFDSDVQLSDTECVDFSDLIESEFSDLYESDMEDMNEDELDPDDDDPDDDDPGHESQLDDDSDVSELQRLRTGDAVPLNLRKLVDLYTWCAITSPSPGWYTCPVFKTVLTKDKATFAQRCTHLEFAPGLHQVCPIDFYN